MAVASPSTLGLVARMISLTPSLTRESSPLIFRSSGPMPCSGESAPISTWYLPLNSRVLSMAATFCGSSTTQITRRSRASLQQNAHGSSSRSEEHTSELQSHLNLVCRLLLEKKKKHNINSQTIESRSL